MVMLCTVLHVFFFHTGYLLPALDSSVSSVYACTAPVPDISVRSARNAHPYPAHGFTATVEIPGCIPYPTASFVGSLKTTIPLPDNSLSSVKNSMPYRAYPYPTQHNLGNFFLFKRPQSGESYAKQTNQSKPKPDYAKPR